MCIDYWFIKSNPFLQMKIMINLEKDYPALQDHKTGHNYFIHTSNCESKWNEKNITSLVSLGFPEACEVNGILAQKWIDVFEHRWSYVRKALRRDDIREEIKRRKKKSLARQNKRKKGKKKIDECRGCAIMMNQKKNMSR